MVLKCCWQSCIFRRVRWYFEQVNDSFRYVCFVFFLLLACKAGCCLSLSSSVPSPSFVIIRYTRVRCGVFFLSLIAASGLLVLFCCCFSWSCSWWEFSHPNIHIKQNERNRSNLLEKNTKCYTSRTIQKDPVTLALISACEHSIYIDSD